MPAQPATCEPCRLRRVKCDLRDRGAECTSCLKRKLKCPGVRSTSARKRRRGNVVDKVDQYFGLSSPSQKSDDLSESYSRQETPISVAQTPLSSAQSELASSTNYCFSSTSSPTSVISFAERQMVNMELQGEIASSLLQCAALSHGHKFQETIPMVYLMRFRANGKRFEDLDPAEEVMTRCLIGLGARTSMHPALFPGADLSFPLTLGILREGPCRQLTSIAVERFGTLGLWRKPTQNTIQVALIVYLVTRSTMSIEKARPFASTAVQLFRQYLETEQTPSMELEGFITTVGVSVLFVDSLSSAETGRRPDITEDDLEDWPVLRTWLERPFVEETQSFTDKTRMLQAAMARLLRSFATKLHHPMRRGLLVPLATISQIWDEQSKLSIYASRLLVSTTRDLQALSSDSDLRFEASRRLDYILSMTPAISAVAMFVYDLLTKAVSRPGGEVWLTAWLKAFTMAQAELKRLVKYIKTTQTLTRVTDCWLNMTRLFAMLETTPQWVSLLSTAQTGSSDLTEDECQTITEGLQQAGWGAGFAVERWLEVLRARGLLLEGPGDTLPVLEPVSSDMFVSDL